MSFRCEDTTEGGVFGWEPDTVTLQLVATAAQTLAPERATPRRRDGRTHISKSSGKTSESGDAASVFVDLSDSSLSVSETLLFCGFFSPHHCSANTVQHIFKVFKSF